MTIEDNGTTARVTVRFDGNVRDPMPSPEQEAVGVDLYDVAGEQESDYQLYASGTDEGWLAYLDTPDGFVKYPGTFAIGRNMLVFTVPWTSLGGMRGTQFEAFVDWDKEGTVLNSTGADQTERARFTR